MKNLYAGDVLEEAASRVGVSQANSSRWARAWNDGGVGGLRSSFGGRPPPKLSDEQFSELCEILEEGQPWTPRAIHALIEERYSVTYDPTHLSRKLRASGMHYAKPRPMDPRSPENADEILAERCCSRRRRAGASNPASTVAGSLAVVLAFLLFFERVEAALEFRRLVKVVDPVVVFHRCLSCFAPIAVLHHTPE